MSRSPLSWRDTRTGERPMASPGVCSPGVSSPGVSGTDPRQPSAADWLAAQERLAVPLAGAALAVGRLEARLSPMDDPARAGCLRRLALTEIEQMLHAQGTPLARDQIGLDAMAAKAGGDLTAMAQARWALRRLDGRSNPARLRDFLALHRSESRETGEFSHAGPVGDGPGDPFGKDDSTWDSGWDSTWDFTADRDGDDAPDSLDRDIGDGSFEPDDRPEPLWTDRPTGTGFDAAAAEYLRRMDDLSGLHPLARAPAARMQWRLAGLSPDAAAIESAVWAARDMARCAPDLSFVPLGRHGRAIWADGGPPAHRLSRHLEAVTHGAGDACRMLDRIAGWAVQARQDTAAIKGRNPGRVIDALAAHPALHTSQVEALAGISRDTAERLLARMRDMGLIREITGARRFRVWTAAL